MIHGVSLDSVRTAMRKGIESILDMNDVAAISAGNFGGQLGKHKVFLKQLWE